MEVECPRKQPCSELCPVCFPIVSNVCLFCCSLYLVCVLIVVIMGRWYEFSACIVCQVVRLYSVVEIVVMFDEVACCSVVCGTLMVCRRSVDLYGRQSVNTRVSSVRSRRM